MCAMKCFCMPADVGQRTNKISRRSYTEGMSKSHNFKNMSFIHFKTYQKRT